jgi:hypothetical protein
VQQFKSLCDHFGREEAYARKVATRAFEAPDKAEIDRVATGHKNDWDRFGRCFGRKRGRCGPRCGDHGHRAANQVGGQPRQAIVLTLGPAVFDRYVSALDVACFGQASVKCGHLLACGFERQRIDKSDHRHRRRLRARRERPRDGRAADNRNELAPPHSITSSARASSVGGISRPRVFAVFRLTTSWYLVGSCTGSSPAFAPRRMRST